MQLPIYAAFDIYNTNKSFMSSKKQDAQKQVHEDTQFCCKVFIGEFFVSEFH